MRINRSSCLPSIPARAGLLPLVNTVTTRLAISERLAVMAKRCDVPTWGSRPAARLSSSVDSHRHRQCLPVSVGR